MGDVLSLIEKAEMAIDDKKAAELEKKLMQNRFDLNDLLDQFNQIRKMGSLRETLAMLPGIGKKANEIDIDERKFERMKAIILSMTEKERTHPEIINPSRKKRIAAGSGQTIEDVNRLLSQFKQMQKMFKQFGGKRGGKRRRKQQMRLPQGFDPSQLGM